MSGDDLSDLDGVKFLAEVEINELCDIIQNPSDELDGWLEDKGIDASQTTIGCASIGIYSAVGGAIATVVGVACGASTIGCVFNDAIRENTPCGAQKVKLYWNKGSVNAPLMIMLDCEGEISEEELNQIADDLGEELEDVAEDATDFTVDLGQDVIDSVNDIFDEGADQIDDLIDKGKGIIFG